MIARIKADYDHGMRGRELAKRRLRRPAPSSASRCGNTTPRCLLFSIVICLLRVSKISARQNVGASRGPQIYFVRKTCPFFIF